MKLTNCPFNPARQLSDSGHCGDCGYIWPVNDPKAMEKVKYFLDASKSQDDLYRLEVEKAEKFRYNVKLALQIELADEMDALGYSVGHSRPKPRYRK